MPRFDVNAYVDVQERITRFWEEYPDGRIETNLMSPPHEFERCRYAARVYKHRDFAYPDATGWAQEFAGGAGANQTSWEENCETSSIGRALANMGYATTRENRPSRQEMDKANRQPATAKQPAHEPPTDAVSGETVSQADIISLTNLAGSRGIDDRELKGMIGLLYGHGSRKDLTKAQYDELRAWLAQHDETGWGVLMEFVARMQGAANLPALSEVGNAMGEAGIGDEFMRTIWRNRRAALEQGA